MFGNREVQTLVCVELRAKQPFEKLYYMRFATEWFDFLNLANSHLQVGKREKEWKIFIF